MEKLLAALAELGIRLDGVDDAAVKKIAKGFGLNPADFVPRGPVVVERYTNTKRETNVFAKTPSVLLGKTEAGKSDRAAGQYIRIDAIPQLIADLQEAQRLFEAGVVSDRQAKALTKE